MKVILLERVERLGSLGDVVSVRDGFARNFLLPQSKALRANNANMKVFEVQRGEIESRNAKAREGASKVGEKLDGATFVMIRQAGEGGQLYGSVSGRDVADAVNAEGGKVDRSMVALDRPIKTVGMHPVKIRLHAEGGGASDRDDQHRAQRRRGRPPGAGRERHRGAVRGRAGLQRPGRRRHAGRRSRLARRRLALRIAGRRAGPVSNCPHPGRFLWEGRDEAVRALAPRV